MSGLGTQYTAPEGFEQLEKGVLYHLLRNDPRTSLVSMVWFSVIPRTVRSKDNTKKASVRLEPAAHLLRMDRDSFEKAVLDGAIVLAPTPSILPFWLDGLAEEDLNFEDESRRSYKLSHRDRIDAKLAHIQPMINRLSEVLASDRPEQMLNEQARICSPKVNETRFRLWFFAYLAFGRNRLALHYAAQRIGR